MVPDTMNALAWLRKHLDGEGGNDIIREMVKVFAEELMSADADSACGASWGERSPERVNSRNGYRARDFNTRAGSIELAIPKLRSAATSRTGCSSPGAGPRRPWWRWWPRPTWPGCQPSRNSLTLPSRNSLARRETDVYYSMAPPSRRAPGWSSARSSPERTLALNRPSSRPTTTLFFPRRSVTTQQRPEPSPSWSSWSTSTLIWLRPAHPVRDGRQAGEQ